MLVTVSEADNARLPILIAYNTLDDGSTDTSESSTPIVRGAELPETRVILTIRP